jgi:argininosuccinate synthase
MKKIILAFSGGLDTSAIVPWLREQHGAEVIAYCSDLGNSPDPEKLNAWAMRLGAKEFIFEDLREEFVTKTVFPALRAGATYQSDYLLGTALGRPVIAERVAHWAKALGADAIAHGATGKGNDQIRFERSWAYLAPELDVIAPWKTWSFRGRKELIAYLKEKGIDFDATEKTYSVDANLFHRSCEGGVLENPELDYNAEEVLELSKVVPANDSNSVEIQFQAGLPVAINGKTCSASELLTKLNELAGLHGVGVLDLVEERTIGLKSRGIYETPGGTLLHFALKNLKQIVWDRSLLSLGAKLGAEFGELAYDGFWHSDARKAIDAFFIDASQKLSGAVGIKLAHGQMKITKRSSPFSLYSTEGVSFDSDSSGTHHAALGYCKIACIKPKVSGARDAKIAKDGLFQ